MNTTAQASPATDSVKKEVLGGYLLTEPIRPAAPCVAFDTTTPTEIDPQYERCACCGVWAVDCLGGAS